MLRLILRSVLDCFSIALRSVLVRFSFVLRSVLVHPSFILRLSFVRASFGNRRSIEDGSKKYRRYIWGNTEMHRNSNGKPTAMLSVELFAANACDEELFCCELFRTPNNLTLNTRPTAMLSFECWILSWSLLRMRWRIVQLWVIFSHELSWIIQKFHHEFIRVIRVIRVQYSTTNFTNLTNVACVIWIHE